MNKSEIKLPPPVDDHSQLPYDSNKICDSSLISAGDNLLVPGASDSKESVCSAGDPSSIPGPVRYPGERNGYPFQYSCLENSRDRGA